MRDGDDIKVLGGFLPNGKCVSVSLEALSPTRMKKLEERGVAVREATIAECRAAASCAGFKRSIAMIKRAAIAKRDGSSPDPMRLVLCETEQGSVFRCARHGMPMSYWYALEPVWDIDSTRDEVAFDVRDLPSPYNELAKAAGDPSLATLCNIEAFRKHIVAEQEAHRQAILAFVEGGGVLVDEIRRQDEAVKARPPLVQGPIQEDIPF